MKILMVCLGNICRSPLAEGIMQQLISKYQLDWEVDSAGTSNYHQGELPDKRSIEVAANHGIDITNQRSRQIISEDLSYYDLILAMEASNYNDILALSKNEIQKEKVKLILNYSFPNQNRQVPDPYLEGGFEDVFKMLNQACNDCIKSII